MPHDSTDTPAGGRAAFALLLPLLLLVVLNGLGQWLYYTLNARKFVEVAVETPSGDDTRLFVLYTFTMIMGVALALFLVGLALHTLARRARLDRVYWRAVMVLESLFLFLILVDGRVYVTIGLHLDSDFVLRALSNPHFFQIIGLSLRTWITLLVGVALIVMGQVLLGAACRLVLRWAHARRQRWTLSVVGLLCCVLLFSGWRTANFGTLAILQGSDVVDALPMFQRLLLPTGSSQLRLHYPAPGTETPRLARRPHLLYILAESLRADALSAELTPNLWRFISAHKQHMIRSRRHYSGGHTTEYGTFSYLFGLDAYHYYPFMQSARRSYPLDVLKRNGYQLSYATSTSLRGWFNGAFIVSQFDTFREYTDDTNDRSDQRLLTFADRAYRRAERAGRPMFTFLFFSSTHHNYLYPPVAEHYRPVLPRDYNHLLGDAKLRSKRREIVNRYRNSVRYLDHLVGELLNRFAPEIASGRLALVLSGDHGEEFWEHGLMGHGATRFNNPRTQVPLVMYLPGIAGTTVPLSGHADLLPTLLDYLGPDRPLKTEQFSSGRSLLRAVDPRRTVVVSGTGFPFTNRNVAVQCDGRKFWLYRRVNEQQGYRCRRVTTLEDQPLPRIDAQHCRQAIRRFRAGFGRFLKAR